MIRPLSLLDCIPALILAQCHNHHQHLCHYPRHQDDDQAFCRLHHHHHQLDHPCRNIKITIITTTFITILDGDHRHHLDHHPRHQAFCRLHCLPRLPVHGSSNHCRQVGLGDDDHGDHWFYHFFAGSVLSSLPPGIERGAQDTRSSSCSCSCLCWLPSIFPPWQNPTMVGICQ